MRGEKMRAAKIGQERKRSGREELEGVRGKCRKLGEGKLGKGWEMRLGEEGELGCRGSEGMKKIE